MWKISFALDLGRSFDSISLKLDGTVVSMENLYSFCINPAQWGASWGLREFKNFWKMKTWPPIFLKFDRSITCCRKWCFPNFWLRWGIWEELGAITLLKIGFDSIFKKFFHCILVILSKILWNRNEWSCNNFQCSWTIKKVMREGEERMKKHSQKPILEKRIWSKCLMKNFTRTPFTAQFWLDFLETW